MNHAVIISDRAQGDLDEAFEWLFAQTSHATEWLEDLHSAIASLAQNPHRCPFAPESDKDTLEFRQLLFGNKRHAYRIIFTIVGDRVLIHHFRHAARSNR